MDYLAILIPQARSLIYTHRNMPSDLLNMVSCGHFHDLPTHFMMRTDPQNYLIIWVLGGRGYARTRGEDVVATPGTLLVFHPHHRHEYGSDADHPWDIVWVHFEGNAAAVLVEEIAPGGVMESVFGLDEHLLGRFMELVGHYPPGNAAARLLVNCLLWGLLGLMAHRRTAPATADGSIPLMQKLQAYVQRRLAEPIQAEELAETAGVSLRQLNRLFHRLFGTSPMEYVIRQRLMRAAEMLEQTQMPVKQIAASVGIEDPYYFSRLFTRHLHATPTEWRHRSR